MPRDRSISPQRETRKRRRSRSESRDKDRGKDNDRDINRDRNRDRDRERSKDRERDRDPDRKRRRHDRSRSRHRRRSPRADSRDRRSKKDHKSRRSRSRSEDVVFVGEQKPQQQISCPSDKDKSVVDLTSTDGDNKSNTEPNVQEVDADMMMKLMGFGSFDSTKGKQVENNDVGAKRVVGKRRKYRQYMNRAGGFNKPLDPSY